MRRSILLGDPFQDLFFFYRTVKVNGATLARPVTLGVPKLPHLKTGPPGILKRGATFLFLAIKDIPARSQHHQIANTGQGKAPFMDEVIDLLYLGDIKGGIKAVIGISFPDGLDEPLFLIFPDALLGEIHQTRDIVDEIKISYPTLFVLSPGH